MIDKKTKRRLSIVCKANRKANVLQSVKAKKTRATVRRTKIRRTITRTTSAYTLAERTAKFMVKNGVTRPKIRFKDQFLQNIFEQSLDRALKTYTF